MDRPAVRLELIAFLNTVVRPGQSVDGAGDETNLIDAGVIDSLALIQIIFWLEQNHDLHLHKLGIDPSELASINGILKSIDLASG
jgi:acyl carrier protein